ncbi:ubiquinone biosynthesis protein [Candidatus Hakubella thermalkaliphila]|uniref:Ubiquinone biosynthesis protein n=2 Tax=Candidatus Hakubella thermalkaliphila TaxID=2754717 RepID=A0A6V8P193_9ACTN|nr:ubiquinone biosynthesis protein [Candidatus Hakubella thermalkaliphila]
MNKNGVMDQEIHFKARFLKIAFLFLRVLSSYYLLFLLAKILGKDYQNRKISGLNRKNAIRIREAALRHKGVLIKIGQVISARADFMPLEYLEELSRLQDEVPPVPFSQIRERVIQELGGPPEAIYSSFEESPIAAASLGQVHSATLSSGQRVAVKIQYPGIEKIVSTDLATLKWITGILSKIRKGINFNLIYSEFSKVLYEELDYVHEGHNAEKIKKNFKSDERVIIPSVIWDLTTRKVLTLEFVEGIKITEVEKIEKAGIDRTKVTRLLLDAYCKMMLKDGFFHGDPHPGNIFVQSGPRIAFVDFGIAKDIPPSLMQRLGDLLVSLVHKNPQGIVQGLVGVGILLPDQDFGALEKFISTLIEKYGNLSVSEYKKMNFSQEGRELHRLLHSTLAIQIPNDFIFIGRTLGLLNGLGARLDPEVDLIDILASYVSELITVEEEDWIDIIIDQAREIGVALTTLPQQLQQFLAKANAGKLEVRIANRSDSTSERKAFRFRQQLLNGVLFLATFLLFLFLRSNGDQVASWLSAIASGLFLLLYIYSSLR